MNAAADRQTWIRGSVAWSIAIIAMAAVIITMAVAILRVADGQSDGSGSDRLKVGTGLSTRTPTPWRDVPPCSALYVPTVMGRDEDGNMMIAGQSSTSCALLLGIGYDDAPRCIVSPIGMANAAGAAGPGKLSATVVADRIATGTSPAEVGAPTSIRLTATADPDTDTPFYYYCSGKVSR